MEIQDLKQHFTILDVADLLGIQVNKQGKAHCPFHEDKTPSLQFSKEKNIATCFSSRCSAGTMDIIGLTEKYMKINTHEAIMQLKEWAGVPTTQNHPGNNGHPRQEPDELERIAILTKAFQYYENGIRTSRKSKAYLDSRGLIQTTPSRQGTEVGFNSGNFHNRANENLKATALKYGLVYDSIGNSGGYSAFANPNKITYFTDTAHYYVKGGLRQELDRLQVSLMIEAGQQRNYGRYRNRLDLYENKQVERMAREAAEKLSLRADLIELDLYRLTDLLEDHRDQQTGHPSDKPRVLPSATEAGQCKDFLSKPNLIPRFNDLIGKAGVVGEENNRVFLFCIAASCRMPDTLHALIQGSSGSGKTHLLVKISSFIPNEDVKRFTRVTESSFYNYGQYDLQNKLICLEDLDGMKEEAQLAFRELQSREMLSSSTTGQDEKGNNRAYEKIVYGPIASMACTTKGEIYEDNMNRCFLIAVDETQEQTHRIIQYQNKKASGKIDSREEKKITEFIQNCIRMLKPYEVINPYADKVQLPEEAHKIRRLNDLYQSFVKQITLMNQYRRKKVKRSEILTEAPGNKREVLITEKEDLQVAAEIMFDSIVLKIDELDGSLRLFYEQLKDYIKGKGNAYESYSFGQREIRQALNISKSQLQRYIHDLLSLEYIYMTGGHINKGYRYKVAYWDDVAKLKGKVQRHLQGQLDQLELNVNQATPATH
jgi:DNA primase